MEKSLFDQRYSTYRQAVETYLSGLFSEKPHWADLYESMRYSLLAGGKRIRPVMTLEFARLAGLETWQTALPVGCALELVHTYSLIHDDLPCMDDDDLRRGKPTNHKVYGETLAVLAGDALQPEAFRLILTAPGLDDGRRAACALELARAAGADGMVAGQVLDTLHAPKTEEELGEVHRLKTGAMIAGACRMGVRAAGGSEALLRAATEYAQQLGMAFQIRDDLLDVIGDAAVFGKPIGSDREEGKITFVDLLGADGCSAAVERCTQAAKDAVASMDTDGFLCALADSLAVRDR
ncbi:polyprenyl synthetase family protein [uncultured Oscillibacter sp.]|uniref:polyprenyl synthetase family protein n=1 Tax=uncultured Oscillibacter sp. TaxID=876091 RepID=UPI0025F62A40|nr:farnesyl diphosphate synthase [uncultured Oscillibacter sp.]